MSELCFKAKSFKEKQIGKIIWSSKRSYEWVFEIDDSPCELMLMISRFSGNYQINLNKTILIKSNLLYNKDFSFPFKVKGLEFEIYRKKNSYDLSIEGTVFKNFYEDTNWRKTVVLKYHSYKQVKETERREEYILDKAWLTFGKRS